MYVVCSNNDPAEQQPDWPVDDVDPEAISPSHCIRGRANAWAILPRPQANNAISAVRNGSARTVMLSIGPSVISLHCRHQQQDNEQRSHHAYRPIEVMVTPSAHTLQERSPRKNKSPSATPTMNSGN